MQQASCVSNNISTYSAKLSGSVLTKAIDQADTSDLWGLDKPGLTLLYCGI